MVGHLWTSSTSAYKLPINCLCLPLKNERVVKDYQTFEKKQTLVETENRTQQQLIMQEAKKKGYALTKHETEEYEKKKEHRALRIEVQFLV